VRGAVPLEVEHSAVAKVRVTPQQEISNHLSHAKAQTGRQLAWSAEARRLSRDGILSVSGDANDQPATNIDAARIVGVPGNRMALIKPRFRVLVSLSHLIGEQVNATTGRCCHNSLDAQSYIMEAVYVEGFVSSGNRSPVVYKHGWLEMPDGVIEPTPGFLSGKDEWMYFAAARWTRADVKRLFQNTSLPVKTPLWKHHSTGTAMAETEQL